jgi:DNA-binding MarR family transcriptional regulator
MKSRATSSPRMEIYVPLVQEFAARVVLFHETVAQRLGLHATDVKAIRLLGGNAMTAGRLAEHAGLTGAAVTALVDRLEAAGYAVRERDADDRRKVTIRTLPAKVHELDQLYASQGAEMSRLLSKYSATEFAAITDYFANATKILAAQTVKLRNEGAEGKSKGK